MAHTGSPRWYPRLGAVLVLVALLGQLLTGCGIRGKAEIERAERAVAALPGVTGVDFLVEAAVPLSDIPDLSGHIVVRPAAWPDEVAAVMAAAVDQVAAAGPDGLRGHLLLRLGDALPPVRDPVPEDYLLVDIRAVVTGAVAAAQTRHWLALRETLPHVRMSVEVSPREPGFVRSAAVDTTRADLPADLTTAFAAFERVERPVADGSTLSVVVQDPGQARGNYPVGFSARSGVPPPEVLTAMRAMAELAPAEPRYGNGVSVHWYGGGSSDRPYLDVELSIGLDEFAGVPGDRIDDLVAGSATERLALAHRDVLDAAGVPYRLRAAAFTNPPFLEVDRRSGG